MTDSFCLKYRQTCNKSHNLYAMCSKCPPPMHTKVSDVDERRRRIKNEWADLNYALFIERTSAYTALVQTVGRHFEHILYR